MFNEKMIKVLKKCLITESGKNNDIIKEFGGYQIEEFDKHVNEAKCENEIIEQIEYILYNI